MAGRYGYSRRASAYSEHWYTFVNWPGVAMVVGLVGFAGAVVWLVILGVQEHARWEEWCTVEMNGHIDSTSQQRVQSTVTADGKPGTTIVTDYTYYCLTEDGRIIDIKG